jgi:hypothetical protein
MSLTIERGRRCAAALALFSLLLTGVAVSSAADVPQRVAAHLEAGEFAPALSLAHAANRGQADDLLGQIAAAQATAGLRNAALATAQDISDDLIRSSTLSQITSQPIRARGGAGGVEIDFDPLIELIEATVAPDSWDANGGPGAIDGFEGGVFVDAEGVLRPLIQIENSPRLSLARSRAAKAADNSDARRPSPMRKVSLTRLEKMVQMRLAAGEKLDQDMLMLAGLQRIEYVFVYPESGEIVLAGPAGDWRLDAEGRAVNPKSGRPVCQLDDLVVVLRHMTRSKDARFGCNIKPRPEALAKTQALLKAGSTKPIPAGKRAREAWLEKIRSAVGKQDIEVYGVDPRTRVGRVMVEADYRMKLIGMGLEPGVQGVTSYLDSIKLAKGEAPPTMDVLRWWFTLNYDAVKSTADGNAFAFSGQGAKVLSENEMLTKLGKRVHTGKSEHLNREFAAGFTKQFEQLATKYPVYAELRNIFDMALVGALIRSERLDETAGWRMSCFGDAEKYQVALARAPRQVETVINHRVINKVHVVAGVSGGVTVDPRDLVNRKSIKVDRDGRLNKERNSGKPVDLPKNRWWWD